MRFVAVLLVLLAPAVAQAQTCRGQVKTDKSLPNSFEMPISFDGFQVGAYAGGGNDHWFGNGGGSWFRDDDLNVNLFDVGGTFGRQVAANPDRRVMVCPLAFVNYGFATPLFRLISPDLKGYILETGGGVSVGVVAYQTATLGIVPTAAIYLVNALVHASGPGGSDDASTRGGRFLAGVGLVMGRSSITPMLSKEFGGGIQSDLTFQLTYAVGFGGSN